MTPDDLAGAEPPVVTSLNHRVKELQEALPWDLRIRDWAGRSLSFKEPVLGGKRPRPRDPPLGTCWSPRAGGEAGLEDSAPEPLGGGPENFLTACLAHLSAQRKAKPTCGLYT